MNELKKVKIYSDGSCIGNPGPGGYGTVLLYNHHRKEISVGFRLTTNNRMEMMGAIAGLNILNEKCAVILYTDSEYVVNGIEKGWAKKWRANNWVKKNGGLALNGDLWEKLITLCDKHSVRFQW